MQTAIEAIQEAVQRLEHAVALTPVHEREALIARLVRYDEAMAALEQVAVGARTRRLVS